VGVLSGLRPGDQVSAGEVWAAGPAPGTAWVAVPVPDVAGVLHGPGRESVLTVGEQRARLELAVRVTRSGVVLTPDPAAEPWEPSALAHTPTCPGAGEDQGLVQRDVAVRAALSGNPAGMLAGVRGPGVRPFRSVAWCPSCLGAGS
jgi:hypothetical protein